MSILTYANAQKQHIPNFYIFKRKLAMKNYTTCENCIIIWMHKMDDKNWHFLAIRISYFVIVVHNLGL
jgi:hypothetical protein